MSGRSQQVALAEGLARQGHIQPAVEACYQALRIDDADPLIHCLLAHLMLEGDFYDEAIEAATRAIEIDPDCSPAYLALGLAYDRRGGMWDQSILVWHELAEVVPDLVTAHVQLGEAFSAAAFDEEAIDAWRKALELDPHEARAMYNLAIAALRKEGVATALPGFRKAGELDPSQDDFFFSLAGICDDGTPAPDPDDVAEDRESRLEAAGALAFEEDFFSAVEVIRWIFDEDHDDADALALSAYLYIKQEAINEAMACSLRALSINKRTRTAIYCLGVTFSKRPGLNEHAARVFGALAKSSPDEPIPHVLHAEALLGLQKFSLAEKAYQTAVRLDPTCVRARFGLAAVFFTKGRHAEAMWEIRRAAYHDTRRQGLFWDLYDSYTEGSS